MTRRPRWTLSHLPCPAHAVAQVAGIAVEGYAMNRLTAVCVGLALLAANSSPAEEVEWKAVSPARFGPDPGLMPPRASSTEWPSPTRSGNSTEWKAPAGQAV